MRQVIGFVVGLYITAAIAVFGGGVYGFMTGQPRHSENCTSAWVLWAIARGAVWPKAYMDEASSVADIKQWLLVQYDPLPEACD
jgi:hypothetical protein